MGGSGVGAGIANLIVELAALSVIALHPKAFVLFFLRQPRTLSVLVALSVLLPLVQLIPLPPVLWQSLPGRDMVVASLDLAGGQGWYPVSLDQARTLTAFLGTLLPLTIIVVGSVLSLDRLRWLAQAIVAMGVIAMLYGTLQVIGPEGLRAVNSRMSATFADWNAAAIFFGGCLLLVIALDPRKSFLGITLPTTIVLSVGVSCLLLTGVLLTQSRTGIILLAAPMALLGLRCIKSRLAGSGNAAKVRPYPGWAPVGAAVLMGLGLASIMLPGNTRLAVIIDRFEAGNDGKRVEMRADALSAVQHYWFVGAGMGTFDEVFQVDESLEYLSPRRAGRAHMDYYELAIEAGLPGLLLAAAWLIWVAVAFWKALRVNNWIALAGAGFLACCALQSLLSFPLRNQTMLAMAGFAVVLLQSTMRHTESRR